jgi:hypothetical protein
MRGRATGSSFLTRRAVRAGLIIAALAAPGCGDDDTRPVAHRRDAGSEMDSGPDGEVGAGDRDGSQPDKDGSSEDDDGGTATGGKGGKGGSSGSGGGSGGMGGSGGKPSMPDPTRCEVSEEDNSWFAPVPFAGEGQYSLTIGSTGFGVAYRQSDGCDDIQVMPVQVTGDFSMPATLVEDCSKIREVSLLHVGQGWRLIWVDNSAGSNELQMMQLTEDMSSFVGDMRTRLTENELLEERRPVLTTLKDVPIAAFIAQDTVTNKYRIATVGLSGPDSVKDVVAESDERKPVNLAFRQIGDANAVVAWSDEVGLPGVWVQRTDLEANPVGDPVLVSEVASPGTTVDLAARDAENEGGAILYSVNLGGTSEVRFRRLNALGEVLADEIKVVSGALQGRDASFARLGGGYVIAYRALPGGAITENEIRITFVSKEGILMRDAGGTLVSFKVASAGQATGRTTLRVSNDGQLLIGFIDGSASTTQFRVVRKRLDCTL